MAKFISKFTAPLIKDDNDTLLQLHTKHPAFGRGHKPRDWKHDPFGKGFAGPFSLSTIPRSEWPARIEHIEKTKSSIQDLTDALGVKIKNQATTNYCWIFAPVKGMEIVRAKQGQRYVPLSPASVGAKIKNFRNVGGWGTEGLKYIADHGLVPSSKWPDTAIDRKYDTDANNMLRVKYRLTEWWDLRPRNFEQLATCLLLGIPVAIGLNWWGHEVLATKLVLLGRDEFGVGIDNSWDYWWGEQGRAVLTQAKATPDDAVAPRVAMAA